MLCLTGCIQVEKVIKLNLDGSGTIEEMVLFPKAALATLQQMAGANGKPVDVFDECLELLGVHFDPARETTRLAQGLNEPWVGLTRFLHDPDRDLSGIGRQRLPRDRRC